MEVFIENRKLCQSVDSCKEVISLELNNTDKLKFVLRKLSELLKKYFVLLLFLHAGLKEFSPLCYMHLCNDSFVKIKTLVKPIKPNSTSFLGFMDEW